jgi:hypothetical protein
MGKKKKRETGNFLPETAKVHPIHLPGTLLRETQWKDMYSVSTPLMTENPLYTASIFKLDTSG